MKFFSVNIDTRIRRPSAAFGRLAATVAIVVTLSVAASAIAQNTPSANSAYSITDLGVLPLKEGDLQDNASEAYAINASGAVIGSSELLRSTGENIVVSNHHAFMWAPTAANGTTGTLKDLGGLPGYIFSTCNFETVSGRNPTYVFDLNSSNSAVGNSWTSKSNDCFVAGDSSFHAALYSGGSVTDLGTLPQLSAFPNTRYDNYAVGINDAVQIVGYAPDGMGTLPWFFDTVFHDLGRLPGFPYCISVRVNNNGQVIGHCQSPDLLSSQAFLHARTPRPGSDPPYAVGSLTEEDAIGTLGGVSALVGGINQRGVVVGQAQISTGEWHAFLFQKGVTPMLDLGTLVPNASSQSNAQAVNNANDVVGASGTATSPAHAVLWKGGRAGPVDLNSLIDSSLGWELITANGINDAGQIVGMGILNGQRRAFLMTKCGNAGGDTDGDGLCDDWERFGVNVTDATGRTAFLNLPAFGADPRHKDIFVQADYMVADDHSHKPKPLAMQIVSDAFANAPVMNPDGNTGIVLHIDCGPDCTMNPVNGEKWGGLSQAHSLDHNDVLGAPDVETGDYDWTDFDQIKNAFFPPERKPAFHYAVFAHDIGLLNDDGTLAHNGGVSRSISASDLIISLGLEGTIQIQAGDFMHELGHNLGLGHGGGDHDNFKPNYLSVMNYSFIWHGLSVNGAEGLFDYSRFVLPDLDENNLDETIGLNGGTALADFGTHYFCVGFHEGSNMTDAPLGNAAIDWDCNSDKGTDTKAVANINGDLNQTSDVLSVLHSFNDWDHLVFTGGSIGDLAQRFPLPSTTPDVREITPAIDAHIPHPFDVAVVASPGIARVFPSSSFNSSFTITNRGSQTETYSISAASTVNWWNLTVIPNTLTLAAGASAQLRVPANIPGTVTTGSEGDLTILATSLSHPRIRDSADAMLVVKAGIVVPSVAGVTQTAAATALTAAGLSVGTVTLESSATIPAGNVISQSPAAGAGVALGSAVNLVLSSGPPVFVPNVVGVTQAAATSAIKAAGLTVGAVSTHSSTTVAAGNVISQAPAAGSPVATGSAVDLVVSSGTPIVVVPNVVGLTQAAAISAITAAGLKANAYTRSSSTVPAGNITLQDPDAGTSVALGSWVNLEVSTGPPPVQIPNVLGLTQTAATSTLTTAGFKVGVVSQSSSTFPAGTVISYDPAAPAPSPAYAFISPGLVNLVVSSGPPVYVAVPNLTGQTLAAATNATSAVGLTATTITRSSPTVPSGSVISQDPRAGASVNRGSLVSLVVSSGPPILVSVPDVVAQTPQAAITAITGAGLVLGRLSASATPGSTVVAQYPIAGAPVVAGSSIDLLSGDLYLGSIPGVVGQTQSDATDEITFSGFVLGAVSQVPSTAPAGTVLSQNPRADWRVLGSPVNLLVSAGPPLLSVPNMVGLESQTAVSILVGSGLVVGEVATQASSTVPGNIVISQSPAAGSPLVSPINLVISSGPSALVTVPNLVGRALPSGGGFGNGLFPTPLRIGKATVQYSSGQGLGAVLSQDPVAGASVPAGSLVNVVLAGSPARNVVGLDLLTARASLYPNGIAGITTQPSSTVPAGYVISQSQPGGRLVGQEVSLVVSSGSTPVLIPNLVGKTQLVATNAATQVGLTVTLSTQFSATVLEGSVISQTPAAGASLLPGAAISLVVASLAPTNTISTVAGHYPLSYGTFDWPMGDNGPATSASLTVRDGGSVSLTPNGLAFGPDASLYINDGPFVRRVDSGGTITTVAGTGYHSAANFFQSFYEEIGNGDGGLATHAGLFRTGPLAVGPDGSLYITEGNPLSSMVRRVDPAGIITTVAGRLDTGSGVIAELSPVDCGYGFESCDISAGMEGVAANQVRLPLNAVGPDPGITGITAGPDGSIYVSASEVNRVRRIDPSGIISTYAGIGATGPNLFAGDGGPAVQAELSAPGALAFGPDGSLYIADENNFRVRRVSPTGIITTVAGNGPGHYSGDGVLATQTPIGIPAGLAVARDGTLYISDKGNNEYAVRRVGADGIICTVAGVFPNSLGATAYTGDGGLPFQAELNFPTGLGLALDGSLYIADTGNGVVRRVAPPIRCASSTLATVPNVVGQTQAAATAAITAAGLTVGSVTSQASATMPAGSVISQAPAAGAQVAYGSTVDLLLSSTGPTVPPVTTATLSPQPNANGWNNSDVTVLLTATNASGSSVKQITVVATGSQTIASSVFAVASTSVTINTEGVTTISFFATNTAGDVESMKAVTIKLDKTPPAISRSRTPDPNQYGWNNTDVTVKFACSDTLSGLAPASPPANTVVSAEGAGQSVNGACSDLAGNTASATLGNINIDKTPPDASSGNAPAANANGWNNTNVTVSFTGTDSLSGIDSCTTPVGVTTEGVAQPVSGTCVDKAGNVSTPATAKVNIDKTSPVASAASAPAANANSWNNSNVNVSFSGTDSASGIDFCSAPVAVTTEGAGQTFSGTCTDKAGNVSAPATAKVSIDKTSPVASAASAPAANANGWNNSNVNVSFSGTDSASGIDFCSAPVAVTTEGAGQTFSGTCTDKAGNVSTPATAKVNLDKTSPVASAASAPAANANGWNNSNVNVSFSGADSASGIDFCSAPVAVSTEGAGQTFSGTCTDKAGNVSSPATAKVNLDKTPPVASAASAPAANANGWNNTNVNVSFSGADSASGIDFCSAPVAVTTEGAAQTFSGTCTDKAGNVSTSATTKVNLDKTPPVASAANAPAANPNGWNNTNVTVSFSGSDSSSGIDFCSAPVAVTTEGAGQTFSGTCTDKAGNVSTAATAKVNIDKTPPVAIANLSPASTLNGWDNTNVTVSFTGQDSLSGIDFCSAPVVLTADGTNESATGACTDKAGNAGATTSKVNIDRTPPVISGMPAAGCSLWPVDQKLVQVATVTASDAFSGIVQGSFKVTGISSEPIGPNDPKYPDIVITPTSSGGFTVQLRADRLGKGNDRIYTLTATATDLAGNNLTSTVACTVPHDQAGK